MILPTKRLPQDRALLAVGGQILRLLTEPKTVSKMWIDLKRVRDTAIGSAPITYDWFVLALDLLFSLGALRLEKGLLFKE
jgi:hypothetical protein